MGVRVRVCARIFMCVCLCMRRVAVLYKVWYKHNVIPVTEDAYEVYVCVHVSVLYMECVCVCLLVCLCMRARVCVCVVMAY